jgi:hypothetical protein
VRGVLLLVVGGAVGAAGVVAGFWWLPFAVGLVIGMTVGRARYAVPTGAVAGLLAWGVPLAWAHARFGAGSTAVSLAAIMGFGRQGVLPVVLTCAIGLLLGLTGAWLGSAIRGTFAVSRPPAGKGSRSPQTGPPPAPS